MNTAALPPLHAMFMRVEADVPLARDSGSSTGRPAPETWRRPRCHTTTRQAQTSGAAALTAALAQFDAAADHLALEPGLREVLRVPQREYTVRFPVKRDDGSTEVFTGLSRAAQRRARSGQGRHPVPPRDGPRRRPRAGDVDDLEVRPGRRAVRRARRAASPAIRRSMSTKELEALTRRFATELEGIIGPDSDIPAPDVGTNAQTMAWIMDTVSMHRGYSVPGVVTGKPIAIGGSVGRADATGQGVVYCIEDAAARARRAAATGARVAVQGFGNVGEATARLLHEAGARSSPSPTSCGGRLPTRTASTSRTCVATSTSTARSPGAPGTRVDRQRRAVRRSMSTSWSSPRSRARSPQPTPLASGRGSSPRPPTAR